MLWIALFGLSLENNLELAPVVSNELESQINHPPILDVVSTGVHQAPSQAAGPGHQIPQPSYVTEAKTRGDVVLDIPRQDSPLTDSLYTTTVEHFPSVDGKGMALGNTRGLRSSSRYVSMLAKGFGIWATTIFMLIVIGLPQIVEFWEGNKSCERLMRQFAASFLLFPFIYAGFKALAKFILEK